MWKSKGKGEILVKSILCGQGGIAQEIEDPGSSLTHC